MGFSAKPVNPGQLLDLIDKALAQRQSQVVRRQWQKSSWRQPDWPQRVGYPDATNASAAGRNGCRGLFSWRTGNGRTLAACYLHRLSTRGDRPIIFGDILQGQEAPLQAWCEQAQGRTLVLRNIEFLSQAQQLVRPISKRRMNRRVDWLPRAAAAHCRWAITLFFPISIIALP